MPEIGGNQSKISKIKKKSKGSNPTSSTYAILLAIFIFCAIGLFIINDHHSSGASPTNSNQQIKLEPKKLNSDPDRHAPVINPQQTKGIPNPPPILQSQSVAQFHPTRKSTEEIRAMTLRALKEHPIHDFPAHSNVSIQDLLFHMSRQKQCEQTPIIITMAKVGSPIYWQLVENFQ